MWSAPPAVPRCRSGAAVAEATAVGLGAPVDSTATRSRLRSFFSGKGQTIPKIPPPLLPADAQTDATMGRVGLLVPTADQCIYNAALLPAVPVVGELWPASPFIPHIQLAAATSPRQPYPHVPTEVESPLKSALSRTHRSRCTSLEPNPRRTVHFAYDGKKYVEENIEQCSASEPEPATAVIPHRPGRGPGGCAPPGQPVGALLSR